MKSTRQKLLAAASQHGENSSISSSSHPQLRGASTARAASLCEPSGSAQHDRTVLRLLATACSRYSFLLSGLLSAELPASAVFRSAWRSAAAAAECLRDPKASLTLCSTSKYSFRFANLVDRFTMLPSCHRWRRWRAGRRRNALVERKGGPESCRIFHIDGARGCGDNGWSRLRAFPPHRSEPGEKS